MAVPVRVTSLQTEGSRPASEMSRLDELSDKQEDITVHVPTTSPPQGVPAGQELPAPPVPPPGGGELVAGVHAPETIPKATISAKTAGCTFTHAKSGLE